ncbi:MAG: aldehyde dehydrogenase family protein, partial [Lacisediminihabitans sp.]
MAFFDPSEWDGKLYSSGWTTSNGGSQDIMEPATETAIGRFGVANGEDVARAVSVAHEAQKSWAATSYEERAAVLRRAGDLLEAHAETSNDWLIREAGSAKGKAAFESHMVSGIFYAAAAVAMAPYGQLLRSGKPRLSLARRLPVG